MSKLRSVSTGTWSDPWFEELDPKKKLIFLYLITNEKTNMLGIYEASVKKISFETGINKEDVSTCLNHFEKDGKIKYQNNFIILVNFLKHQNFNTNMKKGAIKVYELLPKGLKANNLKLDESNAIESFERLSNHYGTVSKREYKLNINPNLNLEKEDNKEKTAKAEILKQKNELFLNFWDLYDKKAGKEKVLSKWLKLSQEEMKTVFNHLPLYVESTPDKKFRQNPLTYLNQKSFNNEIINSSETRKTNSGVSTKYSEAYKQDQQRTDSNVDFTHL